MNANATIAKKYSNNISQVAKIKVLFTPSHFHISIMNMKNKSEEKELHTQHLCKL